VKRTAWLAGAALALTVFGRGAYADDPPYKVADGNKVDKATL